MGGRLNACVSDIKEEAREVANIKRINYSLASFLQSEVSHVHMPLHTYLCRDVIHTS